MKNVLQEFNEDDASIIFNSSRVAPLAYDAVWSLALGLNATIEGVSSQCGSTVDLRSFNPLSTEVEVRACIGALLSNKINNTTFNGASVSL